MKLILGILLISVALAKAERDWSKIFPNHLTNYRKGFLPHGLPSAKITGGEEAEPHSIPYQVAIFLPTSSGTFLCGGSLISTRTVLTAAHCVEDLVGDPEVVLGAHKLYDESEPSQVRINASRVIIHRDWSNSTLANDIALLVFSEPVQLNEYIQTEELARNITDNFQGSDAVASGWGLYSDSVGTGSPVLREVTVPIISNSDCSVAYWGSNIRDTHICASGNDGKSICSGDSGGPLTVNGVQVGITSFVAVDGCEAGWPSVYTRITHYYDWIISNIV